MRPSKRFKASASVAPETVKSADLSSRGLFEFCEERCLSVRSDLLESKLENGTRGLFAKVDIPEDTVLFAHKFSSLSERDNSILSFASCMTKRKGDKTIYAMYERLAKHPDFIQQSFLATVCCLMIESTHAESSHLKPYLEWLPLVEPKSLHRSSCVELCSLSLWPEEGLQYIKGTSVYLELLQFKKASRNSFNTALDMLSPLAQHLREYGVNDFWYFYCRCCACVQAYSFSVLETEQSQVSTNVMVPLMDAFNASVAKQNVALFFEKERLECLTLRDVRAGEELYNTFGEMTVVRSSLMRRLP